MPEEAAHAAAKIAVHPAPKGSNALGASATASLRSYARRTNLDQTNISAMSDV